SDQTLETSLCTTSEECVIVSLYRLYQCDVSDEGCAALTSALRSNPSHLRDLDLSCNNLGDSGVKSLSAVLENPHCKLETLTLRRCGVSDEGCAALTSALRSNPSHLRELYLSNNNLGDSGKKLLSALKDDKHYKLQALTILMDMLVRGTEVMGKFGVKERNLEGQMVVDFAKRMDMAVVNTYFQKREEHRVTYKSGGRRTQVDYILCRRGNLKEISDCKVVVGESAARQHRMGVCRMTLMVCKKKRSKIELEKKTKWWKLKKEKCCEELRQKLRQALGGQVVLPDDWETTAEVIRETERKVLGLSSGRRKEDKETWWWNEEVQDSIQRKRLAKKKWNMDRTEENRQEYKELQRRVKREVSKPKQKAYDELYTRLDTREGEKDLYRLARQRDRDGKDVQQVRVIKDIDERVLTSEESVQRIWKEYFEELMNEENEREKKSRRDLEKEYDRVQEFKYLGSTVQSNGECGKEENISENQGEGVQDSGENGHAVWFRDSVTEEETGVRARGSRAEDVEVLFGSDKIGQD
ncbi:hypothetical protein QTP70_029104, partial [Hemibagrus guttatus]